MARAPPGRPNATNEARLSCATTARGPADRMIVSQCTSSTMHANTYVISFQGHQRQEHQEQSVARGRSAGMVSGSML